MGENGEKCWRPTKLFLGEFFHSLDKEFRIALPARLREAAGKALEEGLCLLCGAEPCITVYTQERLRQLLSDLVAEASLSKTELRNFKRSLGSTAVIAAPDAQGRIRLPEFLRAYAGITKEVAIVGVVDAMEIWDAARYRGLASARRVVHGRLAPRGLV